MVVADRKRREEKERVESLILAFQMWEELGRNVFYSELLGRTENMSPRSSILRLYILVPHVEDVNWEGGWLEMFSVFADLIQACPA